MSHSVLFAETLSALSLLVSLWAATISRLTARRTTEPILILRIVSPAYLPRVELRNTGSSSKRHLN